MYIYIYICICICMYLFIMENTKGNTRNNKFIASFTHIYSSK